MIFSSTFAFIRHRPVIAGCLALTAALAVVNFYLRKERHVALKEHDEIRRKGEVMLRALTNRTHIDTDLAALQSAITQIDRNLLDEQSMEVNLGYFYRLEKPAHVRLVRLNQLIALPSDPKSAFKTVPFSMQITGSYRNTMSFLRALETAPRIVRIRNCSFERSSTNDSELLLDLTLDVLAKT